MLYDFLCQNCDHTFEELKSSSEANPICPKCQGATDQLFTCGKAGHYFNALNTRFVDGLLDRNGMSEYKD